MSQATKALDDLFRKERVQNIRSVLICFVLIAMTMLAGFLFSAGDTKQVRGTTKGLFGQPGGHGDKIYLLVNLDDGKEVRVSLPNNIPYIKGSRIIAVETTTRLFGYKRYGFLQYSAAEGPSNEPLEPSR